MKTVYFHGYHKTDKQGRPFYIDCPGRLELKRLFEITTEPEIQKYYIREYERLLHVRLPACSKAKGELVQTSFTVMDLNGFRMSMMNKKVSVSRNLVSLDVRLHQNRVVDRAGQLPRDHGADVRRERAVALHGGVEGCAGLHRRENAR